MDAASQPSDREGRGPTNRKCEFCKGDMPDGATVCMHCGREASSARGAKRNVLIVQGAWVIAIILVVFAVIAVAGSFSGPYDPVRRITEACAKEYPEDTLAQSTCAAQIMQKRLMDGEADKLRRAEASSR